MNNESWVDSIVEAMQILGGDAYYTDLYPLVKRIREEKNLSLPISFESVIRERIQYHSSNSKHFSGVDIFVKLGRGHWGLRNKYKNIKTFNKKPIEEQKYDDFKFVRPIEFEDVIDDVVMGEDGKQLLSIEEAKSKKLHYRYEGRLKQAQIKKIKAIKGYQCQACGFLFKKQYPSIGDDFIECHHKIPYGNMKEGEKRELNVDDFFVLCSNCHRMMHRLNDAADLDTLKRIIADAEK